MDIQELLGTDYKEGMTVDEINTALQGKKIADLSTGDYVRKDFADATQKTKTQELNKQIEDLKNQLSSKLTDEEKRAKEVEDKDKKIEELTQLIKQRVFSANKSVLVASTSEMRDKIGIKSDDKEFDEFLDSITLEDESKNATVSSYLGKLLKNAYEQGQKDAKKETISKTNSIQVGDSQANQDLNIGVRLAKKQQKVFEQNKKSTKIFE
ncbi:MAG TPA: hypothetical protein IAB40_06420 [Candidatus Onthocola stercoravium]|nr:hypothetical protein [Candidatus Onthocola stercoravium]